MAVQVTRGPLQGLKVLEFAGLGPSPYACMLMADMGADVLRLERGDFDAPPEVSWDLLNRSRPSVSIDLKHPRSRRLILELCEEASLVVEGFRPGVMERLGYGPDDLLERNPRLVYARMTGYGQDGPLAKRAGHDLNYIAVSGALWPIGRGGERPVPPLNLVGDFPASAFLVMGALAAIRHAERTGEGQVIDVSMVDTSASMMAMVDSFINEETWTRQRGNNLLDSGAHFYDTYETSDGKWMAVAAIEDKFYRQLVAVLGLAVDTLPPQMLRSSWPEMKERFANIFATRTREEWTRLFQDTDSCVTPVLSPWEAPRHPYNSERHVHHEGELIQPNPVPRFSKTPGSIASPARLSGSGTVEGLTRWGVTSDELASLISSGALGTGETAPHEVPRPHDGA